VENFVEAYATAMAMANEANERRYASILSGYDDRLGKFGSTTKTINKGYDSLIDRQERIGDSQRLDLQDQYGRALGNTRASMISRGLGNSTLSDSARRGVDYDLARSKIALEDSLAREYAGVYGQKLGFMERANLFGTAGLRKDKLDFMERKQELGPQAELYAQLANLAGQGAGGYAMGGGFTAGPMGGGGGGGGGVRGGGGGGFPPRGYPPQGFTQNGVAPPGMMQTGAPYLPSPLFGNAAVASAQTGNLVGTVLGNEFEPGMDQFPGWSTQPGAPRVDVDFMNQLQGNPYNLPNNLHNYYDYGGGYAPGLSYYSDAPSYGGGGGGDFFLGGIGVAGASTGGFWD